MIQRYSRPEMAKIWGDRNKYLVWLRVEFAVCEGLSKEGLIPRKDWIELKRRIKALIMRGGVNPARIEYFERFTKHDVIAFTSALADKIGPLSRYVHFGLTSSDVIDTSMSVLIQEAGELLLAQVDSLLFVLKRQAIAFKKVPTIGRSHGIFAEPTSFGLKFLGWYCEWRRNRVRLERAIQGLRVGKLSGAVGVNAHWSPTFEERVLKNLGLDRENVSTQVLPRDRHAELFTAIAIGASSLERIAVELRHLQRSEVSEVIESFTAGQKGSSAMPHKRNPISSENLTGCARLLRSYAQASLENIALWHERDISHSSVERVIFPDATILLDYALDKMIWVLSHLVVRKERVSKNLFSAGSVVYSGHFLLELVRAGVSRERAYAWIQECALRSIEESEDFVNLLVSHPKVKRILPEERIRSLGSVSHQLRNVGDIYKMAFR